MQTNLLPAGIAPAPERGLCYLCLSNPVTCPAEIGSLSLRGYPICHPCTRGMPQGDGDKVLLGALEDMTTRTLTLIAEMRQARARYYGITLQELARQEDRT